MRTFFALVFLGLLSFSNVLIAAEKWKEAPAAHSRKLAAKVTNCIVDSKRLEVDSLLQLPFGDMESSRRFRALDMTSCLHKEIMEKLPTQPSQLTFPPLVLRGQLYEAMFQKDFGRNNAVLSFSDLGSPSYSAATANFDGALASDYRSLMRIGECAVRAAPLQSRDLVTSKIASKAEMRAFEALNGSWNGCLPRNNNLNFSPEVIRGTIAEPLYKLTEIQMAGAAS